MRERVVGAAMALLLLGVGLFATLRSCPGTGARACLPFNHDIRLNHFFLEHGWRALFVAGYDRPLWSPGFFYPFRETLALSDNLLGSAPIYWAGRVVADPLPAFLFWTLTCWILNYACFFALLRVCGVARALSGVGAFWYAFGMPRWGQVAHPQLYPAFFLPLSMLALVRWVRAPSLGWAVVAVSAAAAQLVAGIYLGLMYAVALPMGLVALWRADRSGAHARWSWLRRRGWALLPLLGAVALGMYVFMRPYISLRQTLGGPPPDQVECFLPRPSSWFLPPEGAGLPSLTPLRRLAATLPCASEQALFMGFGFWIFLVVGLARAAAGGSAATGSRDRRLGLALLLPAALTVVVTLRLPGGQSVWPNLAEHIPGLDALRAVGRFSLVVYAFAIPGVLLVWKSLRPARAATILLATLSIAENLPLPGGGGGYEGPDLEAREVAGHLAGAEAGVVHFPEPGPAASGQRDQLISAHETGAMWASLYANTPVMNGYSSRPPPGYPGPAGDWSFLDDADILGPSWGGRFQAVFHKDAGRDAWQNALRYRAQFQPEAAVRESSRFVSVRFSLPLPQRYGQEWTVQDRARPVEPGGRVVVQGRVRNTSSFAWRPWKHQLTADWYDDRGSRVSIDCGSRALAGQAVYPGEAARFELDLQAPAVPGRYALGLTMIDLGECWFRERGAGEHRLLVEVGGGRSSQP